MHIQTVTAIVVDHEMKIEEGDSVKITTKQGDVISGDVDSISDSFVDLTNDCFSDLSIDIDKIESIEVF